MTKPAEDLVNRIGLAARRQGGACDHDDGDSQRARSMQLCDGSGAAGVFGNNQLDVMRAHQLGVTCNIERAARDNHRVVRHRRRRRGRIDKTQDVMVLRLISKAFQVQAPDCEHDPLRCAAEGCDGRRHVSDVAPLIRFSGLPGRTSDGDQRDAGGVTGSNGIAAHLLGKRMRCVYDMRDLLCFDIGNQSGDAAKAANTLVNRLWTRAFDTARIRQRCRNTLVRHGAGELACLSGAAQDQEVVVHGDDGN